MHDLRDVDELTDEQLLRGLHAFNTTAGYLELLEWVPLRPEQREALREQLSQLPGWCR